MNPTLALLVLAALPGAEPALPNLDFSAGRLTHWEGQGFTLTAGGEATSADRGPGGQTAILHRTFVLPANASHIRFTAAAVRPAGVGAAGALDVVLEAPAREIIPRSVRRGEGWTPAATLSPPEGGKPREYAWNVEKHA